ncbi:transketolase C-terminal domain-containing protein [Thermocatellispora tengchongensis]|uniref:transketolase C-terminal domain-containing protein n=1 Tax=Thermocatellispora tengchongensis TaxID=1073253 RepID=UPI003625C884
MRCPSGGNRGYGPTHSQSPHKHFIGVPGLDVYELTPFHDPGELLERMLAARRPCLLFEDKVLYTLPAPEGGTVAGLFDHEVRGDVARVFLPGAEPDCAIVAHGGVAHRVIEAMRTLLLEEDVACELLVPARLYPLPELPGLERAGHVCVVEDGSPGGSWGAEVARVLHPRLWPALRRPITLIGAAERVIPAAPHLEREVLPQAERVHREILEALS